MSRKALLAAASMIAALAAPAQAAADPALAKEVLLRSIAFRTVEGAGQTVALANYYASVLKAAGYADKDIVITPMADTATLEVTLKGRSGAKPILLLGHMDVVEAKAADWTRDPFVPVEENGYIFGRGSEDNKYDVAMMVATMARLKREGFVPTRDVVLTLSGDEETAMATTAVLAKKWSHAGLVLNGDGGGGLLGEDGKPLYYALQAGEKTYADISIEYSNPGGHSSRPGKVNAIYQLSAALDRLGHYAFPPQTNELTRASLALTAKQVGGPLGAAMARFAKDPGDTAAADIISAEPEYIGQVRTTCVATQVEAGHAQNALPQRAAANINCRIFPGVSVEAVRKQIETVVADPQAKVILTGTQGGADASPLRPDVMAAVSKAVHARSPGLPIMPAMIAGATDSLYFRALGIPSYGVGTLFSKASDMYAHGLNERVPSDGIKASLDQWNSVIRDLSK